MTEQKQTYGQLVGNDSPPLDIPEAETPYVLVDERRVDRNIDTMALAAKRCGVALRPHIKTHKMPYFAHKQIDRGATGITVAKVSEAEVMVHGGIKDVFIAYPTVVPSKIKRIIALTTHARLIVGVDSQEGAAILEQVAAEAETTLEVRLEVDTGLRRSGARASDLTAVASFIAACTHLRLTGIYTFRGAMLNGEATDDLKAAGLEEGQIMVKHAETLREAGHNIVDVSVGSSPTGIYAAAVKGVTEIRPGTYIFNDRMQYHFRIAAQRDCAALIVATVVSCPHPDLIVIDGGSKAFATDVQPNTAPLYMKGFGHILESPEAILERLSEEHGVIRLKEGHTFQVGDRLHIIPNHICSSLNLYNSLWLVGNQPPRQLEISARGHSW
ncbi:alanine racemase [Paenibacillus taiwanensis]|uniref:alanine racemase n=1 Tax=Paenibacillus taiwanensis TaxID=401638 RepID=UPI0004233280|nr:alanine racemase [Paenibacillus taiwanensis]